MRAGFHKRIVIGTEIEAYSIGLDDHSIGRKLSRPRPGLSEKGERFTRDTSIGSEYNSRPFETVREALFLLKGGLRKYLRRLYRGRHGLGEQRVPLLVGGWTNRFAGTHLHLSVAGASLDLARARSLAFALHDHLPLLVAMGANSPVWNRQLTPWASNRFERGSDKYFKPVRRGRVGTDAHSELCFVPGRKTKPPTLELRVLDSNLPEYIVATLTLVKAASLHWLRRLPASNRIPHADYLRSRQEASQKGMRARLCWNGQWLPAREVLDRFLWAHHEELAAMDIPGEIYDVLRLVKRGCNGTQLIAQAVELARTEHPQTWQRRFAKRYARGLADLLSGNTLQAFAAELGLQLPSTRRTWLGRRSAPLGR